MTVTEDITHELMMTDTEVEATIGQEGMRRYALEAGMRICVIPEVRSSRIDSAELIGFIRNTIEARSHRGYDELARIIVDRFGLDSEVAR